MQRLTGVGGYGQSAIVPGGQRERRRRIASIAGAGGKRKVRRNIAVRIRRNPADIARIADIRERCVARSFH